MPEDSLAAFQVGAFTQRHVSLWGGCSSSMPCVGYRPRFETWVRIRYFAGLSILQRADRSSSNFWGSKVLAKSLQTAIRGPPSQQLRRPATRKPALAGFCGSSQHFLTTRRQLAALPSRFLATRRPTNRFLVACRPLPSSRLPSSSQASE